MWFKKIRQRWSRKPEVRLAAALRQFHQSKRVTRPRTRESYQFHLAKFCAYFGPERGLATITAADLDAYLISLQNAGWALATRRHNLGTVKTFFRWAHQRELLWFVPPVPIERKVKTVPRGVTPETVIQLLRALEQYEYRYACHARLLRPRDRAVIYLLVSTGIRAGELLNLQLPDLRLAQGYGIVNGKSGDREVPLEALMVAALRDYLVVRPVDAESAHLFVTQRLNALTAPGLRTLLNRYARAAGIIEVRHNPHAFRHGFAAEFLDNGGNLMDLKELLGHTEISTTAMYLSRAKLKHLKQSQRRHSPLKQLISQAPLEMPME